MNFFAVLIFVRHKLPPGFGDLFQLLEHVAHLAGVDITLDHVLYLNSICFIRGSMIMFRARGSSKLFEDPEDGHDQRWFDEFVFISTAQLVSGDASTFPEIWNARAFNPILVKPSNITEFTETVIQASASVRTLKDMKPDGASTKGRGKDIEEISYYVMAKEFILYSFFSQVLQKR
ncbi:uncharacterized protein LOC132609001 [Lycium barbarum]|uniref:uncharacterized protein LOC132609001 n=1 Tax=Lycium barbarum TaxID=112863 RepID=UPI00293EE41A|nr:uncharacterized protein LOC132609001 [Lycium barbarum]